MIVTTYALSFIHVFRNFDVRYRWGTFIMDMDGTVIYIDLQTLTFAVYVIQTSYGHGQFHIYPTRINYDGRYLCSFMSRSVLWLVN